MTRRPRQAPNELEWDGRTESRWTEQLSQVDAVVNMTGYGLEHWPWTPGNKRRFLESRVGPGRLLASAMVRSPHRPRVFLQISGINYYGLRGPSPADETTPAAEDYLARLTVEWEAATRAVEECGVRWIGARSGVVLDRQDGLLPLMSLPVRLFLGGRLGNGQQATAWVHVADHAVALRFLLEHEETSGVYNLVAPTPTSNARFMQAMASALRRPYWLAAPAFLLRIVLGEMSVLVVCGRYCKPARLLDLGFDFRFPTIESALDDLLRSN